MPKYTYKDIIIDPTSDEAKACIGKKVYYSNNPTECLIRANNNNIITLDTLLKIDPEDIYPFIVDNSALTYDFSCIILKKEEPKPEHKYVPFSNKEEFLSTYEEHTKSMKKYGIWIFHKMSRKDDIISCLITEMWGDGLIIGAAAVRTLWKYILEGFIFEDGTPCGKEIKE